MSMQLIDGFLHGANVLYAASYSVRKILWLRVISVLAGISMIIYFYFQREPLWVPLYWSLVFVILNAVHTVILIYERRPLNFSLEEQKLFQMVFRTLTPIEFKKLLKQAAWQDASVNNSLVSKGQQLDHVYLIFSGLVSVMIEGQAVAQLKDGQFIGEMSFLTGETASADVIAQKDTRYISWNMQDLRVFLKKNPALQSAMQLVIGMDLVHKLKKK
jgi:CRP-like cAMP-binding protein